MAAILKTFGSLTFLPDMFAEVSFCGGSGTGAPVVTEIGIAAREVVGYAQQIVVTDSYNQTVPFIGDSVNNALRVNIVAGGSGVSLGTVALSAGTAVIGHVIVDSGTISVGSDVASAISSHFSKSVSTAAVQLTSSSIPATKGVVVKAAAANAGKLYVGSSNAVTANSAAATDGIELAAGDSITLPVNNANLLWGIASQASQVAFIMAI